MVNTGILLVGLDLWWEPNLSAPGRRFPHMSENFDPQEIFTDPIAYLGRFGIEAVVVEQPVLSEAA